MQNRRQPQQASFLVIAFFTLLSIVGAACQPSGETIATSPPTSVSPPASTIVPTAEPSPTSMPTSQPPLEYVVPTAPALPSDPSEMAGIPPILLPGWENSVAESVCLNETTSLIRLDSWSGSFAIVEYIRQALQNMGINVIDGGDDCDATLALDITFEPLGSTYSPSGETDSSGEYCYSGSNLEVQVAISHSTYARVFRFENEESPPLLISSCNEDPENAPVSWRDDIDGILREIWGRSAKPQPYIDAPTEMEIQQLLYDFATGEYTSDLWDLMKFWHVQEAIPYLRTSLYRDLNLASAETLDHFGALSEEDFPVLMALFQTFSAEELGPIPLREFPAYRSIASILGGTQPSDLVLQYMPPFLDPAQDLSTRQAAVVALVQAGDEGLAHIVPLLSDDSTEMQTSVEEQLSIMGPAVIPLLLDFIEKNDYQLGDQAAFRVLSNVSGQDFGEDVAQWRSWWEDVESQIASITEPSQFGEALESPERIIRYATLEKIKAGPGAIDTIPKLAQMVKDEDDLWWLAIQALGAIGEEALPTLIPMISSADNPAAVRFTVVRVLRQMGPEAITAVPALIDELERPRTPNYTDGTMFFEVVVYALNQSTGERFGGDVDAWRSWWEPEEPTPEAPSPSITWTRSADGMVMIHVPDGEFQMGCDRSNPHEFLTSNEQPLHTVYLDAYYIDKYEVTNGQYVEFLNAMGNQEEDGFTWLDADSPRVHIHQNGVWQVDAGYENHPVVEVTWYGAQAYCQWQGMRLPTEAEWEKAARGSSDTRVYPWGNEAPDCSRLNYGGDNGDCAGGTMPVGSYPSGASPYGVMDIAGNVYEWVNDWRWPDGHGYRTYPVDGWPSNPTGPDSGTLKTSRGGCWSNDWHGVRVAHRGSGSYPIFSSEYSGFRCAGVAQEQ